MEVLEHDMRVYAIARTLKKDFIGTENEENEDDEASQNAIDEQELDDL